jgi:uncharacterized protein RhaS with RHS repeats
MYHYKARIYSPTLGRFLQTDPIGLGGGMNLYAYVGNDPMSYSDPTGLGRVCVTAAATGTRIPQEKCVDVDGNRNGSSQDNDLSATQAKKIARSYGDYIQKVGERSTSGHVPDLAPYQKPIGGTGTAQAKNKISIISQFWGHVMSHYSTGSRERKAWNKIGRINVNDQPADDEPGPAHLSLDGRTLTFTGRSFTGRTHLSPYIESYSDLMRVLIHEWGHGFPELNYPQTHDILDRMARNLLHTWGLDGEGCLRTSGFEGC